MDSSIIALLVNGVYIDVEVSALQHSLSIFPRNIEDATVDHWHVYSGFPVVCFYILHGLQLLSELSHALLGVLHDL